MLLTILKVVLDTPLREGRVVAGPDPAGATAGATGGATGGEAESVPCTPRRSGNARRVLNLF